MEENHPMKRGESFKLLRLPVLARNEVFRSMGMKEIIGLSLRSKRIEGMIQNTKMKVDNIEINVNINDSIIHIRSSNFYHGTRNFGSQLLSRWIDKNSTSFQNCVSIFKHLQNMVSFKSICLNVNLWCMNSQIFKEILTEPSFKDFRRLCLENGKIDIESLDLVMGMAHNDRGLHIRRIKILENYYHENAFKFYDICYDDAKWVRIEHLFSLKDSYAMELGPNELTFSDVNTFIKFWIENDHDMVQSLSFKAAAPTETEILFDGIVVLQGQRGNFLVAANPTKQRKQQILSVGWYDGRMKLHSWDKNEPFHFKGSSDAKSWEPDYKVLMILNKKKELEGELERIQN